MNSDFTRILLYSRMAGLTVGPDFRQCVHPDLVECADRVWNILILFHFIHLFEKGYLSASNYIEAEQKAV